MGIMKSGRSLCYATPIVIATLLPANADTMYTGVWTKDATVDGSTISGTLTYDATTSSITQSNMAIDGLCTGGCMASALQPNSIFISANGYGGPWEPHPPKYHN